ncbi:MAG: hypothetical protein RBT11_07215 [Desulfobacterales bacterium]|jgi:hypothetical protein|nr:hypothetical protein [Desulfobacterales bacterium]
MSNLKEFNYWRICAWNGPLFMFVFVVFWAIMGHNLPPHSASLPPAEIAGYFRENANMVRTGMVVSMTFCIPYLIFGVVIGRIMGKIVGKDSVLIDLQVWGAGLTVVPVLVSLSFFLSCVYRPTELPDWAVMTFYDMAWILIDLAYSTTTVQLVAMGVAFLSDKREKPLVPRWFAWYGIWVGISFATECLMPFFKTGAFARDGILNYWIEFVIWYVWCFWMSVYVLKAIPRLEQEALGKIPVSPEVKAMQSIEMEQPANA